LIHEDVVASSASCIYEQFVRFDNFPIIARTDYRSDSSSDSTHFVGSISNAPGFSPNNPNLINDLVLLKLNTTANIPVPMLNQNTLSPSSFVVAGAGPTTTNGPWSTRLLEAEILPQDFGECRKAYKDRDARVNLNEDFQFCAGRRPGVAGVSDMERVLLCDCV
jgi:secreted trypsin-like serine protease